MTQQQETKVRAKFFGGLLALFLLPVYVLAVAIPESIPYTIGALLPLTILFVWSVFSGRLRFSDILNSQMGWLFSGLCLVIGVGVSFAFEPSYHVSWLVSSFVFFLFTNALYNVLVFLGFHIPPDGETWK